MNGNTNPDDLKASITAVEQITGYVDEKTGRRTEGELEFVVRLTNDTDRALHYISDVRATRYDPGSRTLVIALSEEGLEPIPDAGMQLPRFRRLDPRSTAELHLRLPDRLIKMTSGAAPGELAFETYDLKEAREVVVEVAWADVPYYPDTRETDDKRPPTVKWEQHKARAIRPMTGGGQPV